MLPEYGFEKKTRLDYVSKTDKVREWNDVNELNTDSLIAVKAGRSMKLTLYWATYNTGYRMLQHAFQFYQENAAW